MTHTGTGENELFFSPVRHFRHLGKNLPAGSHRLAAIDSYGSTVYTR
jgi:hypothetical protein